jgi:hypothetical protein
VNQYNITTTSKGGGPTGQHPKKPSPRYQSKVPNPRKIQEEKAKTKSQNQEEKVPKTKKKSEQQKGKTTS